MRAWTAFLALMAAIQALRAFFSRGSIELRADPLAYRKAPFRRSLRQAEVFLCVTAFDMCPLVNQTLGM